MHPPDIVETLSSSPEDVRSVLDSIQQQVAAAPGYAGIGDIVQIVLAEALNNVVEHAYGFEPGHPIHLEVAFQTAGVACRIQDNGVAMPNATPPAGDMPAFQPDAADGLPEGGFGWALIHTLAEGLSYRREDNSNHLSFSIPLDTA